MGKNKGVSFSKEMLKNEFKKGLYNEGDLIQIQTEKLGIKLNNNMFVIAKKIDKGLYQMYLCTNTRMGWKMCITDKDKDLVEKIKI